MELNPTIKISELSLADWIAIALAIGKDANWAFYRWQENGVIPAIPMEGWEAIADMVGFSHGWAYHQYKDQKSLQPQGAE